MKLKIIHSLSLFLDKKLPEKYLFKFAEFLHSAGINHESSEVLAYLLFFIFLSEIIGIVFSLILNILSLLYVIPFVIFLIFFSLLLIRKEKRINEIETSAPDFLRQLSSILKVGLSFENAMEDMSKYGSGPLYDEIRYTLIEIKMGSNFDDSWMHMAKRLRSKDLERIFIIILNGRKSGASLANVIDDISDDLRDIMTLKRERKSSVMMAVMFLIISAIVASPFSLGMVSVYGNFMESFGKTSQVIQIAPLAGELYLIIHSFLIGLIISVILYGDFKKGIKFSIPLVFVSFIIFYVISTFGGQILISG